MTWRDWSGILKVNAFVNGSNVKAVVVDGADNISGVIWDVKVDEAPDFHVFIEVDDDMLRCGIDPSSWIGNLSSYKSDVWADNNLCFRAGRGWELIRDNV